MTYAIMVRERDADHEVELCRVDSNPHMIAKAARKKMLRVDLGGGYSDDGLTDVEKYVSVRIKEI